MIGSYDIRTRPPHHTGLYNINNELLVYIDSNKRVFTNDAVF